LEKAEELFGQVVVHDDEVPGQLRRQEPLGGESIPVLENRQNLLRGRAPSPSAVL